MPSYPDLSPVSPPDHLLFDVGYSYALLHRTQELLGELLTHSVVILPAKMLREADGLLEAIHEFQAARLQVRSELYENAAAAAEKGVVDIE
jgi:hypothetical protein